MPSLLGDMGVLEEELWDGHQVYLPIKAESIPVEGTSTFLKLPRTKSKRA